MLWLALYCPTLPLDCILRRWPEGLDPALAVTEIDGTRRLIAAATRSAQACGVFAGQSIATALSLLPDLVLIARKLDDERIALTEAALAALRFTPDVSLRASGLVMEISASLKLFGGRRALKKSIAAAMRVQGLTIAAAEAPTPHGAWLLAQESARKRHRAEVQAATDGTAQGTTQGRTRARTRETTERTTQRTTQGTTRAIHRTKPPMTQPTAQATTGAPVRDLHRPQTMAPGSETAEVASAARPGFSALLDALPVGHLQTVRPQLRRFEGIGIETIADLRRLPAKGLARRFGPELIDELERATGDRPDPQELYEAPSRFDTRIELMARVETAEALVFASQRLLAQLAGWLTARRAAVRGFTLVLHHDRWTRDRIAPTPVPIALATPSNDLVRLGTLVRERLSRLELTAPVLELSLEAPVIVEEEEAHGTLFPEREQSPETMARLLEKLTARLGPDAMYRLERVAEHRPERAWREMHDDSLEAGGTGATAPAPAAAGGPRSKRRIHAGAGDSQDPTRASAGGASASGCGPRPAWLLSEPQPLEVRARLPMFEALPLMLVAGPERIETGWWDDAPATRDYFIGENAAGRMVWIYCERLPQPGKAAWFMQGLFG